MDGCGATGREGDGWVVMVGAKMQVLEGELKMRGTQKSAARGTQKMLDVLCVCMMNTIIRGNLVDESDSTTSRPLNQQKTKINFCSIQKQSRPSFY